MNGLHALIKVKKEDLIWLFFVLFSIIEFYFFRNTILHNIAFFYPTNFDQSSYLSLIYRSFENVKQFGLILGIKKSPSLATAFLFPLQTMLFYFVFGVSRFVSLMPNFIYFFALQLFSLIAVRSISKNYGLACLMLAFIFSVNVPFLNAGGWMDFRIDFMAFCLYGIFLSSAIKSKLFLDKKWTAITTLAGIFLVLLRFITAMYLLPLLGLMVFYLLFKCRGIALNSKDFLHDKIRLKNVTIMMIILLLVVIVYVSVFKEVLYNYYLVGHFLGEEKNIRAKEVGVFNLISLIGFYPTSLFKDQLARFSIGIILASLVFPLTLFNKNLHTDSAPSMPWKQTAVFLFLSLLIPLIVLTVDINKSHVVGSIMVMPVIWLIIWWYLYLENKSGKSYDGFLSVIGMAFVIVSFSHQVLKLQHIKRNANYQGLQNITKMYLDIGNYAKKQHWSEIRLSVDQIKDYLTSCGIEILYYETRGNLLPVHTERMGREIFNITKKEVVESLERSNVLIINQLKYPPSPYPYDESISPFRPLVKNFAQVNFKPLGTYKFMNATYQVFVR